MATDIQSGPLGEFRAASTAGGGTALTTTATCIALSLNAHHAFLTPRNFAGAVVAKVAFNPWLTILKTSDNLATPPVDYSEAAQDGDASVDVVLSDFDTLANGDFLLIGSHMPFRGVLIDIDGANAGAASVLTVTYWNGTAWVTTSATDGTTSGGVTMAVDGAVTWTVPAPWKAESLQGIFAKVGPADCAPFKNPNLTIPYAEKMYWTRWVTDVVFDASTTANSMLALNRSTAYGELLAGQVHERRLHRGLGGFGCVEALTDAGTANLIVNVDSGNGGRF